jgi:cation diffusion facilitator family transporter
LLADTIHNFGDASTAVPLWTAFALGRRRPSRRFTYGYGRVEDVAGVIVVLTILFSAGVAGFESFDRLLHPRPVEYVGAVALASLVGFLGNEAVALWRIRVGKEIHSAALVADGFHARADGWTSLGVLVSAIGVWMGYPLADPIMGLVITLMLLRVTYESGRIVLARLLDGVDPQVIQTMEEAVQHVPGVRSVTDVRARWLGHRLYGEVNIAVRADASLAQAHAIAVESRHELLHHLPAFANIIVHIDPASLPGESNHRIINHSHGGLPVHSHF